MAGTLRILLIDDHTVVRSGVRALLEQRSTLHVIGEATSGAEALELAARKQPDVIVLDLDLGEENGLDLIPSLRSVAEDARILVLTGMMDSEQHSRAVRLGAIGLVQKRQPVDILIHAIERVALGEAWLDPGLVASVLVDMSRARGAERLDPEMSKIATLTAREREVVTLICEGLSNRRIGERLAITETTVRHHLTSIFTKLGVQSRLELVIYAYRNSLVKR